MLIIKKKLNRKFKKINNQKIFRHKMLKTKKHPNKKWEVSVMELENSTGKKFKVTRRVLEMSVAETKLFKTKEKAKKQFDEWLK